MELGPTAAGDVGIDSIYLPSIAARPTTIGVAWAAARPDGGRAVLFRRIDLNNGLIDVQDAVISDRPGFNPAAVVSPTGWQVLYNAHRLVYAIDVSARGAPLAEAIRTPLRGDTRDESQLAYAETDGGALALAHVHAAGDFEAPRLWFQPLGEGGAPVGVATDLGEIEVEPGHRAVYLFGLRGDRFGVVWSAAGPRVELAVLEADGVIAGRVALEAYDAPPSALRLRHAFRDVHQGVDRFAVTLRRHREGAPDDTVIRWIGTEGAHLRDTEIGEVTGLLVRHPVDSVWWVIEPGPSVSMTPFACP